jgi:hypothetical protein
VGDDLLLLGAGVRLKPGSDFGQFRQNLFLLRFDQQCAVVPAKVESKEVEPVIDMNDAGLLVIEFQPTLGEPLSNQRDGRFETAQERGWLERTSQDTR